MKRAIPRIRYSRHVKSFCVREGEIGLCVKPENSFLRKREQKCI